MAEARRKGMRKGWLVALVLLGVAGSLLSVPPVKATAFNNFSTQTCFKSQDCVVNLPAASAGVTTAFVRLDKWTDNGATGAIANTVLWQQIGTTMGNVCQGGAPAVPECAGIGQALENNMFVWRNSSANHIVGNYTWDLNYKGAANATSDTVTWAVRIIPDPVLLSDLNAAELSIRTRIAQAEANATVTSGSMIVDSQTDVPFTVHHHIPTGSAALANLDFELVRLQELDGNGLLTGGGGGGEIQVVASAGNLAGGGCGAISTSVSCLFDVSANFGNFSGIWKASDPGHTPGNYSLNLTWQDASDNILFIDTFMIRLTGIQPSQQAFTADAELDTPLVASNSASVRGSTLSFNSVTTNLTRFLDLNNDGSYDGTGEKVFLGETQLSGGNCASGGAASHFSCVWDTGGNFSGVWRANDAAHIPGNYTLNLTWNDASNRPIVKDTQSIVLSVNHQTALEGKVAENNVSLDIRAAENNVTNNVTATTRSMENNLSATIRNTENNVSASIRNTQNNLTTSILAAGQNNTANENTHWDQSPQTGHVVMQEQQDTILFWRHNFSTQPLGWRFDLHRLSDCDVNGALSGTCNGGASPEDEAIVSVGPTGTNFLTTTNCATFVSPAGSVSCDVDRFFTNHGEVRWLWANGSASHHQGNYTLDFRWCDDDGSANCVWRGEDLFSIELTNQTATVQTNQRAQLQVAENNVSLDVRAAENNVTNNATRLTRSMENNVSLEIRAAEGNVSQNATHDNVPGETDTATNQVWVMKHDLTSTPTAYRVQIFALSDLNANGDFSGVNERQVILDTGNVVDCTSASIASHISCFVDFSTAFASIEWRNTSLLHNRGNYTLQFDWLSGGTVLHTERKAIAMHEPRAPGDITNNNTNIQSGSSSPLVNDALVFFLLACTYLIWFFLVNRPEISARGTALLLSFGQLFLIYAGFMDYGRKGAISVGSIFFLLNIGLLIFTLIKLLVERPEQIAEDHGLAEARI